MPEMVARSMLDDSLLRPMAQFAKQDCLTLIDGTVCLYFNSNLIKSGPAFQSASFSTEMLCTQQFMSVTADAESDV